jgi:hypothetical protein
MLWFCKYSNKIGVFESKCSYSCTLSKKIELVYEKKTPIIVEERFFHLYIYYINFIIEAASLSVSWLWPHFNWRQFHFVQSWATWQPFFILCFAPQCHLPLSAFFKLLSKFYKIKNTLQYINFMLHTMNHINMWKWTTHFVFFYERVFHTDQNQA